MIAATATSATPTMVSADDTDQNVIAMWLAQRPRTTTRSYLRSWNYLQLATGGVELRAIRLHHLQAYVQSLRRMKLSSQVTFIAAIQSLFGFACKIGYLRANLGTLLKRPKPPTNIGPEPTLLSPGAISGQARAVMWVRMSRSKRP